MSDRSYGRVLAGSEERIRQSYERWAAQPVDYESIPSVPSQPSRFQKTLQKPVSVTGTGTFLGHERRTITFEPTRLEGWWFDRMDLADAMPIRVSVNNVWKTARNVVLCSGSPHNYMRMVEHIIALKVGLGVDNVMIRMDSGDPPLFDRGSMNLVEAVERAGIKTLDERAEYVTVKEPVTVGGAKGSFITFLPHEGDVPILAVDCAIDFRSAIGKQRVRFVVEDGIFRHGAAARTNTTLAMMVYCRTIGKVFADIRNLGYTMRNIVVAGRRKYRNEAKMLHKGKSLEAAWHRSMLDLLAAVALMDEGRFAGKIISYKSGHALDVQMIKAICQGDLLKRAET